MYSSIDEIDILFNIDVQYILDVSTHPSGAPIISETEHQLVSVFTNGQWQVLYWCITPWSCVCEVEILLPQEDTASAWGVKIVEPIIVFLRFKCMSLYLDGVGQ